MKKSLWLGLTMLVIGCAIQPVVKENKDITSAILSVVTHLDKAQFKTVRKDWDYDYGLGPGTGLLNTYEYLRSLYSFESLQKISQVKIFSEGPHGSNDLNLTDPYNFGHYNPEFVRMFAVSVDEIFVSSKVVVILTRDSVKKYGLIDKLERLDLTYRYIQNNRAEFNRIRAEYQRMLRTKTWPKDGYREYLPESFNNENYWNWSETVYYFWIRRDIDGTAELWADIIKKILTAYDININDYDCCYSDELLHATSSGKSVDPTAKLRRFVAVQDVVHTNYYKPIEYGPLVSNAIRAVIDYSGYTPDQLNVQGSKLLIKDEKQYSDVSRDKALSEFYKVIEKIRKKDPDMDLDGLCRAALGGALSGLEADYVSDDIAKRMITRNSNSGSIGMQVKKENNKFVIRNTLPNSPARKKGLESGYTIETIDHKEVANDTLAELQDKLYGPAGDIMYMKVLDRFGDAHYISMKWEVIKYNDIELNIINGDIGYVKFNTLRTGLTKLLEEKLSEMEGERELSGLILDFRNMYIGTYQEALSVSDLFLKNGVMIGLDSRIESGKMIYSATANEPQKLATIPIVVVINRDTATVGQMVVAALQDQDRALVIGTKASAEGRPFNVFPFDDGNFLRVATTTIVRAGGKNLSGEDVYPDICTAKGKAKQIKDMGLDQCDEYPDYSYLDINGQELQYAIQHIAKQNNR